VFFITTITFNANIVSSLEIDSSVLIHKISKDYSKKFCNAIAFGLSKESAMTFSYEENKKVFEKRKGISKINKELLAEQISTSILEKCGYNISMKGEKGIQDFKSYYLLKDKDSIENK
tara:strand:- start:88 stop:441 length:354 start_codon:yes stop_codon:yes gene_type:complete